MKLLLLLLGLLVPPAQPVQMYDDGTLSFDSPEEEGMYPFYQTMLRQSGEIMETLLYMHRDPANMESLAREIEDMSMVPEPDESCATCRAFVRLLQNLVDDGNTWDDLRQNVTDLCYVVLNITEPDWDPDIICAPVVENYGPLVMDILAETDMNPLEICILYNQCDRDEENETVTETPWTNRPERPQSEIKHERRTEKPTKEDRKNAIKIAHLTDIHRDDVFSPGAPVYCALPVCCRDLYEGEGSAGYWGEYTCNTALHTVDYILSEAATMEPDIVIYTGDNPPNAVWDETQEHQLDASRWVAGAFSEHFPDTPVFSVVGNHEIFPTNMYYAERPEIKELNEVFGEIWGQMSGFDNEQIRTIEDGGYYSIHVPAMPGIRVIAYNSNYGMTDNFYGILTTDSEEYANMQEFLYDAFEEAVDNDEKVLLLGHHMSGSSSSFIHWGQYMSELGRDYSDSIILHLFGHSHGDRFRMTTDEETGEAFTVQISSPAATGRTDINPSLRMFYVDPDTFTPLDYEQYHLNLTKAKEDGDVATLSLYYTASEEYGLMDLTPASFKDMVDRMEDDDELFDRYRFNERTGVREISPCTGSCKQRELCTLRTTSYDQYKRCRDQE